MMRGNNEEECGGLAAFKRNKYFYGKLMTVRDFEDEQKYMNQKRYLINKAIHGIGLVCGLKVSNPALKDSVFTIDLTEGVALDCCGHEIVVSQEGTKVVNGLPTTDVEYLYVKYEEEPIEPVPAPANTSPCEEICCGNRILERFKLEFRPKPPELLEEAFIAEDVAKKGLANEYYETKLLNCPVCGEPTDPKVFLAVIKKNGDDFSIDEEETKKYRSIVYNNPMLYELLSSHIVDRDNPHEVTAEQVRALKSVNKVGNVNEEEYVSNIDLTSKDNTIRVEPKHSDKKIDLTLNDDSVGTGHIKDGAVTAAKIGTDAVTTEKIKNSAVTAAKIAKGTIKDEKIADDADINEGKIRHLALVYENLKERSLKCIVDSFGVIYSKFVIELSLEIVEAFKAALNKGYYKDDEDYIKFINERVKSLKDVAGALKGEVPEERLEEYLAAVKELAELLGQKAIIPVEIASAVEEVCFYARWLVLYVPARVVTINWNHNRDTLIDQIGSSKAVALAVTFDRDMIGASINEHTFLSMVKWEEEEMGIFRYDYIRGDIDVGSEATTDEAKCIINAPDRFIGHEIKVVLKGDFILDRHGKALDGNCIGGELPSGNGYQGGDFESWFTLATVPVEYTCISGKVVTRLPFQLGDEPLSDASVTVYASANPDKPIANGSTDDSGVYCIDTIPLGTHVDIFVARGEYLRYKAEMKDIATGKTLGNCKAGNCVEIVTLVGQ